MISICPPSRNVQTEIDLCRRVCGAAQTARTRGQFAAECRQATNRSQGVMSALPVPRHQHSGCAPAVVKRASSYRPSPVDITKMARDLQTEGSSSVAFKIVNGLLRVAQLEMDPAKRSTKKPLPGRCSTARSVSRWPVNCVFNPPIAKIIQRIRSDGSIRRREADASPLQGHHQDVQGPCRDCGATRHCHCRAPWLSYRHHGFRRNVACAGSYHELW